MGHYITEFKGREDNGTSRRSDMKLDQSQNGLRSLALGLFLVVLLPLPQCDLDGINIIR